MIAKSILKFLFFSFCFRFGKRFIKCGKYFPNRSAGQIKARYTSNLKGAIKKGINFYSGGIGFCMVMEIQYVGR